MKVCEFEETVGNNKKGCVGAEWGGGLRGLQGGSVIMAASHMRTAFPGNVRNLQIDVAQTQVVPIC